MNKYLILGAFLFFFQEEVVSKNVMPSLKRLRDKVEKALDSADDNYQSFQVLMQQAQVLEDSPHKALRVVGADKAKSDCQKLRDISQDLKNLYWSHKQAIMIKLSDVFAQHKGSALSMLIEIVEQQYHEKKAPMIAFAVALEKELEELARCREQLNTLLSVRSNRESLTSEFQDKILHELYIVNDREQKMNDFIDLVDHILRGL